MLLGKRTSGFATADPQQNKDTANTKKEVNLLREAIM
jgi:hypothetical protein